MEYANNTCRARARNRNRIGSGISHFTAIAIVIVIEIEFLHLPRKAAGVDSENCFTGADFLKFAPEVAEIFFHKMINDKIIMHQND
jgi:hypothetical protein